ncbi:lytic polysaccharide monooxygenase [Chitinivorax sp. B]|uniref:lytic polysaccharide monooxygenase n=1 Tax=Chitinivorax sp. B TaxID=2502235 RepID=UPI0014858D0A|nr:lytic polysaccharide monooxygenase [Chitinivorax sp. B]
MLRMTSPNLLSAALLMVFGGQVFSHGLIQDPPARNWYCGAVTKPHDVDNGSAKYPQCGDAFKVDKTGSYNFMSVLTHARGRSEVKPLPQHVCGFGSETWKGGATPWDQPIDWPTSKIAAGNRNFIWNVSWGPHFSDTEEFRYWITKPGFQFQQGKALTWDDFETQPFCVQKYDDTQPNANPNVVPDKAQATFQTQCTVPARQGRHVIYGEWGRNQWTFERFHGCMDVVFAGGTGDAVKSQIDTRPVITEFVGAGSLVLDGNRSQGSNLKYQWSVTAQHPGLYTLENATQAVANLKLKSPAASDTVRIGLMVSNGNASDNSSFAFTHKPGVASQWTDLGQLTQQAQMLKVGDTVQVRAVQKNGTDLYLPATPLKITVANTTANRWPVSLAQAINSGAGGLRIGVLSSGDQINPVQDGVANRIYAANTANIASAFLLVKSNGGGSVTASYQINSDWGAGYCAQVKVVNSTAEDVTWKSHISVNGNIREFWNVVWSQDGDMVTISGPDWQRVLKAGAVFEAAGFCANRAVPVGKVD